MKIKNVKFWESLGRFRVRPTYLFLGFAVFLGLLIGASIILGQRSPRLAGVNHLAELGYICDSDFVDDSYFLSKCRHDADGSRGLLVDIGIERILPENRAGRENDLLGAYPWVWLPDDGPFLQAGTRMTITRKDTFPVSLGMEFEFVTSSLLESDARFLSLISALGPLPQDMSCDAREWDYWQQQEYVGQGDIKDAVIVTSPDNTESRLLFKQATGAVAITDKIFEDNHTVFCVGIRYYDLNSEDADLPRYKMIRFTIPTDVLREQMRARLHAREVSRVFDPDSASDIISADLTWQGAGPSACEIDSQVACDNTFVLRGNGGTFTPFDSISVSLPDYWQDLSPQQRRNLNPYGCDEEQAISVTDGKCLYGNFMLWGQWEGTPASLQIELPAGWSELSLEDQQALNPYGCISTSYINQKNGRCRAGSWSIWGIAPVSDSSNISQPLENPDLRVLTFSNAASKDAFFVARPSQHPCSLVLDGTLSHIIEGDLYIIHIDQANADEEQRNGQHARLLFDQISQYDEQASLFDVAACHNLSDDLNHYNLLCQQDASHRRCSDIGLSADTLAAVEAVAKQCKGLHAFTPRPPTPVILADCLQLKDSIRTDFIDSIQIVADFNHPEYNVLAWGGYAYYKHATKLPYVLWNGQPGVVITQDWVVYEARFEMVALHEYLHKFYYQDLPLKERLRFHQEALALYEDNRPMFFDYLGESSLGEEVRTRVARHRWGRMQDHNAALIEDINAIRPQLLAVLPDEIKEEYKAFLEDRHGLVAFVYALSETYVNAELEKLHGYKVFPDELLLSLDFNDQFDEIAASHFNPEGRLVGGVTNLELEDEYGEYEYRELARVYYALQQFFSEGYPILALETAHPLSDWMQLHFDQLFDRSGLTAYFVYKARVDPVTNQGSQNELPVDPVVNPISTPTSDPVDRPAPLPNPTPLEQGSGEDYGQP